MTSLRELQWDLRAAVLGGDPAPAAAAVLDDGLTAAARLQIYRNHALTTLTGVLQAAFPVVCRLVDERFFGYAADQYIRTDPPSGPCLFEYGESFPAFLAEFPPCRTLPYLADVARLEWAVHRAPWAAERDPLAAEALQAVAPAHAGDLVLSLDPSCTLLASPWPIERIWRANQPEGGEPVTVDLRAGGAMLEVRRRGDDVVIRELEPATYAFRAALASGRRLGEAVEAALARDAAFDLPGALRALVQEGLVTGLGRGRGEPVAERAVSNQPCDEGAAFGAPAHVPCTRRPGE
ncbi:MAG TPA: DNA-binding domain-containing protein [Methylomirabilota bacterium]|nr:DNA-binding domain-containing protein [Methylomirabilota bacterium]